MQANENALVGTWKLASCFMEDIETTEKKALWGEHPNGYIVLTPEKRWIVIQTAEGRKSPQTDDDRAAAFKSMLAYSGIYRIQNDTITISVDIAWDEAWTGSEQHRTYRIEGKKLYIEAAPQAYANFGGRVMRGILVWTRVS